jgi:uncharacterized protein (DUF433 family)
MSDARMTLRAHIDPMNKGLSETAAPYKGLIQKTPGVCGGAACIRTMRIPVWLLVEYRQHGTTDDTLLEYYPALTHEDLKAAWDYYESNRAEIDARIALEDPED